MKRIELTDNPTTGIQVPRDIREQLTHEEKYSAFPNQIESVHPDKQKKVFDMAKQSEKHTIFECMAGANDKQFVQFNDMTTVNSKFRREDTGIVEFCYTQGREREPWLNPEPEEFSPDYHPNKDRFKQNLRLGAVKFDGMSSRKPNVNKTYDKTQIYYHQRRQPILAQAGVPLAASQSARGPVDKLSMRSATLTAPSQTSARGFGGSQRLYSNLTMEDAGF